MKPQKEILSANIMHSFRVKHTQLPFMDSPWHFHPDYELIYIIKGSGKRFVGDSIENFYPNDLILLGPNVPHIWKNDEKYYLGDKKLYAEVIVIQFKEDALGHDFFSLPEMKEVKKVLNLSKRGVKISGETQKNVKAAMWEAVETTGIKRIRILLNILDLLTNTNDLSLLTSRSFEKMNNESRSKRISKVFEHIAYNFQKKIELGQIAELANMSKTAFCRYFKLHTTKTFQEYLNEVRISYACKLLIEEKLSISQISLECGFNSPSYFNRQFKSIKKETPKSYYLKYKQIT